jgi:hypothetical protein
MLDDLTLPAIERKLRQLVNDLALAQHVLEQKRDAEVEAKHAYEKKRRRLVLSERAPKVGRGEGQVTATEREAWVAVNCQEEEQLYDIAVARREAAGDHLRTLRDQASIVQTLAKSVQISMGLAGVGQT